PGDVDFRQFHLQRPARSVPGHVVRLELREVDLVANVAGEDQRPLRADESPEPLLLAADHRHVTRGKDCQPVSARIDSRLALAIVFGFGPPKMRSAMPVVRPSITPSTSAS